METNPFKDKVTSSFPIGIGSGLALESMFDATIERYDPEREIPNKVNLKEYKYHIWNIITIIRNLIYSVEEKNKIDVLKSKYITDAVHEEIENLVSLYSLCDITPVIFLSNFDKAYTALNVGKQVELTKPMIENTAIHNFVKKLKLDTNLNIIKDTHTIPKLDGKVLITTNLACDLLNTHNKMVLLESNTGKLKTKYEFYTKYHAIGKRILDMLPMVEEVLYILGDTQMVTPLKLSDRLELFQLAVDKHWTTRTSRDKVVSDMKQNSTIYPHIDNYRRIYL